MDQFNSADKWNVYNGGIEGNKDIPDIVSSV